jgi:hypothetical protein
MGKKNRMYQSSGGKKNPNLITIDAEKIRKMEKGAKRLERIKLEQLNGKGAHGPSKKERHRSERRAAKHQARTGTGH